MINIFFLIVGIIIGYSLSLIPSKNPDDIKMPVCPTVDTPTVLDVKSAEDGYQSRLEEWKEVKRVKWLAEGRDIKDIEKELSNHK